VKTLAPRPTAPPERQVPGPSWVLVAAVSAVTVMVIALFVGGGRPRPAPAGIPDAGPLIEWLLPVMRLAADGLGVLTVGLLLAPAVLLPYDGGRLSALGLRCARTASRLAALWSIAALTQIVLLLSDLAGHLVLDGPQLVQFTDITAQGRSLLIQAVLAGVVAIAAPGLLSGRAAAVVLAGAIAALAPPALAGHSGAADDHSLATSSLLVHLIGVSLWVGGLAALVVVARRSTAVLPVAVPRFSRLALWSLVAVGASGVANALVGLGGVPQLFSTRYGLLVLGKIAALAILAGFGWTHRRRTLPALRTDGAGRAFIRLAAAEVAVMMATIGLAVGLAQTPPPIPRNPAVAGYSPARLVLGYDLPRPPTLARLLFDIRPDGFFLAAVALAAALYVTGLRVLRRRGDTWPVGRTVAWFSSLAVVLLVTSGGVARYAPILFSVHMVQHMALNMVAPVLGVLGAPLTLALRTLPAESSRGGRPPRQTLLALFHSWPVRLLTHPLVASVIFVFSLYGLYFSGLFEHAMRNHWGHLAMEVHFLAAGGLFFWVLVGIDPAPRRVPYAARLPLLLVVMAFHAFFGVALLSGTSVIAEPYYASLHRTWGDPQIVDQQLGGGIGWALGEPITLAVLGIVVVQWVRADEREARRFDRRADRAAARRAAWADRGVSDGAGSRGAAVRDDPDDPDDELAAYNQRLAALHRRDERSRRT